MPRRKGQGISPTKRTVHSKDELQSKKKEANSNEDPGGGGMYTGVGVGDGIQTDDSYSSSNTSKSTDTTSASSDLSNSKYLHKKFKKMATAAPVIAPPQELTANDTVVRGPVMEVGRITTGSKIPNALKTVSVTEGLKGKVETERDSSPKAASRGASPSVSTSTVPPASLLQYSSSSSTSSSSSVPHQGRYVCPYCKLACAKPSVLQKHIRAHTNERPYPCTPCGFAFKTKSNLYKHCRSRAHALKMEEEGSNSGTKFSLPSAESSDVEDDEDDNCSNSTSPLPSVSTAAIVANTTAYCNNFSMSSNIPSYITATTTVITTATVSTISATSSTSENNNNQEKPRQIYKPKFHKAALYQEEEQQQAAEIAMTAKIKTDINNPTTAMQLSSASCLKTPPPSQFSPTSTLISNLKTPSSPSPEFLHRHISKIISDNQAIVETIDPHWSKKFLQRQSSREQPREGSPGSPLSPLSSPGVDVATQWPKKLFHRQMSLNDPVMCGSSDPERVKLSLQHSAQSKLALALLRPSRYESASLSPRPSESPLSAASSTPEPSLSYQQPLNLSTTHNTNSKVNSEDPNSSMHRKRCFSEGFVNTGAGQSHSVSSAAVLKDHNILTTTNCHRGQSNSKLARLDSTGTTIVCIESGQKNHTNEKLLYHPQNPEGSIIKDLLLKARAAASAGISQASGVYTTGMIDIISNTETSTSTPAINMAYLQSSYNSEDDVYFSNCQYVCSLCKIPFRNAQNLEIHQRYYCTGESSSKIMNNTSPQHSPNAAMKYVSVSCHSLDLQPQVAGSAEDAVRVVGHTIKGSGLQPLNVAKVSPKVGKQEFKPSPLTSPSRESGKAPALVVPPFPSPGPLLGNTPLVDSYHQLSLQQQKKREDNDSEDTVEDLHHRGPVLKRRRLDSELSRDTSSTTSSPDIRPLSTTPLSGIISPSTTTLRSLEELSKCPMRPNSLQMFGGEVQILDGAGETKTMRIEPSSRGGKSPGAPGGTADLILSLPNHLHPGGVLVSSASSKGGATECDDEVAPGSVSPHIVVTIARSGLHSGGTIVQVPQKSCNNSGTVSSGHVKPPRTSGGSINPISAPSPKNITLPLPKQQQKNVTGGGMILHSVSPSTSPYCTGTLLTSNTNTVTNTFPDTSKLLTPIVPNIATPNLAVPGIPAPNLGHHLPFMPFAPFLADGTLLNPLTSITAYNPLTLPPHSGMLHQSSQVLQSLSQPQTKDEKSPGAVTCSSIPRDSNVPPPPYSGDVVTILHGGKPIPYVPGMPGPHTLLPVVPSPVAVRKEPSPKPLDLASPSRETHSFKITDQSKATQQSTSFLLKNLKVSGTSNISTATPVPSSHYLKDDFPRIVNSKVPTNTLLKIPKTPTQLIPSIKVDTPAPTTHPSTDSTLSTVEESAQNVSNSVSPPLQKMSKGIRPDILPVMAPREMGSEKDDKLTKDSSKKTEKSNENNEESKTKASSNGSRPKFLRPTTLPLKPGTFVPKKHHGTGLTPTGTVLSLVSPETPRPRKSYGQLYLNGHAYTYLGLKCSTRAFFCTLNRPQPMYVPQTPEHAKLSMYSNWKICCEADPNPFGLDPGHAMAFYDSRHRPTMYSIAKPSENKPMILTHSSYWLEKNQPQQNEKLKADERKYDKSTSSDKSQGDAGKDNGTKTEVVENAAVSGELVPRRVKIFDGGFESNEDYIYVRGRGRGRYVCEECGIRCKKPSMLKKHIRTHTDVRPFTCKHCNFSFKTKGNLTKHMKSKAHYKKCMELGIVPVPTVVDDSYIDEECLIRQQALRASRCGDAESDTDENEDEEDDDDDDEEDEEEEQNQADVDDTNVSKGKLEREAVCGLLSLSESTRVSSSSSHYVSAGLIPPSSRCGRPSTYPYSLTLLIPGPNCHGSSFNAPQTPTLTAISAQTEREKVSRNTGLALELRNGGEGKLKEEEGRMSSMIRRRGNAAALLLIPPQQGDTNRYYFPSCRTPTVPVAMFSKSLTADKSSVDGESDSDYDRDNSSAVHTDDEDSEQSDSSLRDKPLLEILVNEIEALEGNSSGILLPMDLSSKTPVTASAKKTATLMPYIPPLSTNGARTPTTPISEILTPVSEPAILLASLCSSVERFPVSNTMLVHKHPDPAETTMLQAYLTERALQDVRMKQHQFHHHGYITTTCTTVSSTSTASMPVQEVTVVTKSSVDNTVPKENAQAVPIKIQRPAAEVLSAQITDAESDTSEKPSIQEPSEQVNGYKPQTSSGDAENEVNSVSCEKTKSKEGTLLKIQNSTLLEKKMSLVPMGSNNIVRNVVVGGYSFSGHQPSSPPTSSTSGASVTKTSSPTKPKAEFLPPSSGPSPSYVSMTDDGRSICVICNKIFSKPSQLRLHVNIHYFERPFRCESCAVSFRTKGHLQKHERSVSHQNKVNMNSTFGTPTTTNPRPFKCDDCKIAFRIHGHLAKHLRSKMHIMKLECVGKLPFGTYAEMEREGISLNEIDTTDCDNSLESLQVLAQKLYEKDPTKLGQWDGERGEIVTSHPLPQMSGGETSSDEGEPLLGCQSPPNIMHSSSAGVQETSVSNRDILLLRSSTSDSSFSKQEYEYEKKEDAGSLSRDPSYKQDMRKDGVLNQSPPKLCISTESLESPVCDTREFVTNCSASKNPTSTYQQNTSDTNASEWNNGFSRTQVKTVCAPLKQFNHHDSDKKDTVGHVSEVVGNKGHDGRLPDCGMEGNQSKEEPLNIRQRDDSGNVQPPEDADYEDASDGDNDGGQNSTFSCSICKQTFPNLGALQVHLFVEHDSSTDMNEDASQSTASSTTTSDNPVMLTSKVPTLHKQKLSIPMLVSADEMSKGLTVNYLSQFRKRPSMTDSGKETQDFSFHGPFSKRPTPDHQDFKVSSPTNMPKMDEGEFERRGNLNGESDSLNLETRVMAASGSDSESTFATSDRYRVTLKDGFRRSECKSVTNMDASVKESDKIQNTAVEGSDFEKDTDIHSKGKVTEEDTEGLHVSVAEVAETCVTLSDSNIQCQKSETNIAQTELKVCSSDKLRQHNTDESAKSDQPARRDNCESSDSRQSPTSEQQKGDSSAPESHQTKHNCDLCGKVQSSQESLQKHLLSHAQARPFVCKFCDAGFISQQLLQSHLVIHQQKDTLTALQ
ncbi:uncharacterized protein LOC111869078 isoform X4 [Cryptotermes secundus]|uniref:uncharacterized protein LOC111869078 isoform X4 n=1 Tax=Cryptotermes secundus TaxID=105785 RepID=UPI000CD7AF66|nr:uncharacterized protein LOC111869078 isoform X4 [Cryptotermes secundus]